MLDEAPSTAAEPRSTSERPSASLLVRCWLEPREGASAPPILRGYVKNLKTGEETYIADLDAVGHEVLRSLDRDAAAATADAPLAPLETRARGQQ